MNNDLYNFSEITISYKPMILPPGRKQIASSKDVYGVFLSAWDENKIDYVEQFKTMFLDKSNKVIGVCDIATGGCSAVYIDPKVIFGAALKANASSIILSHNHPSRNLAPSVQDINLTNNMADVGRKLELPIIDHLIISPDGYYSFADDMRL
jgi:DNA repair protein RadC